MASGTQCNGASAACPAADKTEEKGAGLAGTIAHHYNSLKDAGIESRKESRIFHLRNFNNWVKSVLLGDFIDELKKEDLHRKIKALDMCCGKGGDLRKWMYGKVEKVVFTDIAGTSLDQCKGRYQEMATKNQRGRNPPRIFAAEFHCADCTKERLKDRYAEKDIAFDITSCQFSFHYSFESLPQVEMMLRNACECLKPGGYFVGTTPNSLELVKRLRISPDMSFGNEIYNIHFNGDSKHNLPLFGCKYDFHLEGVVDCPEFLVYFPLLEKLAKEFDMNLVYKKSFADFFKDKYEVREHRNLLDRMNALETYPPERGTFPASENPTSYAHVDKKLAELSQQNPGKPAKVATLSSEEWEAATVYLVFAFQKVATAASDSYGAPQHHAAPRLAVASTSEVSEPLESPSEKKTRLS